MSRRTAINLVFFLFMFAVLLVWATANIISIDAIDRPYRMKAEFANAIGIDENAEVAYLGVSYGIVEGVERTDDGVMVTMKIRRGKQIPEGSRAHLFRKSAVGEPFVDFFPPAEVGSDYDGPYYEPGTVITLDSGLTDIPLEFSELLRSASRLLESVDPTAADTLIHELAVGLAGRGEDLRRLTLAGEQLAEDFAARTDLLDRLAENNTRLTSVFAANRDAFARAVENLRDVSDELDTATPDLENLLRIGSSFAGTTADIVADELSTLDCILHDLEDATRFLAQPEVLENTQHILDVVPGAFINIFNIRDLEPDGVWARVNILFATGNPPPRYDPPHELPPVPAIEVCASTLQSGGVDFVPTGTTEPSSGLPLPATGGTTAVMVALGLAGLAAAGWSVARSRR